MTRVQKIKKLAKAVEAMEKAQALLQEVAEDHSNRYFLTADAGHYQRELEQLLSCDHGGAGLKVLVEILLSEIEQGYYS